MRDEHKIPNVDEATASLKCPDIGSTSFGCTKPSPRHSQPAASSIPGPVPMVAAIPLECRAQAPAGAGGGPLPCSSEIRGLQEYVK